LAIDVRRFGLHSYRGPATSAPGRGSRKSKTLSEVEGPVRIETLIRRRIPPPGGEMRRVLLTLGIGWGLLLSPAGLGAFQVQPSAMQQLKTRQKAERRALKSMQAAQKQSLRRTNIPR